MAIRSAPVVSQLGAEAAAVPWRGEIPEPATSTLGLPYIAQDNSLWCWAACVEMIGLRLRIEPPTTRCEIASRIVAGGTPCCQPPFDRMYPCNQSADDREIERAYATLGLTAEPHDGPLSEDTLWRQLAAGRAVQIGYKYIGRPDGHVLLIGGYYYDGSALRFDVVDPSGIELRQDLLYQQLNPYSQGNADWIRTWLITMLL